MIRSLVRTIMGPSRDPRMAFVTRPLPRQLPDEQVLAAMEMALERNPDPAYLVETLPPALRELTGRDYEVLDRTVKDVTGAMVRTQVMIRDGDVGLWPGYRARAYSMLAPRGSMEATRRAIIDAEGGAPEPPATSPVGKPGWAPPPPRGQRDGGPEGS